MHHEIVALESIHQPIPKNGFTFPPGDTSTLTCHLRTPNSQDLTLLHSRIRNATIIIITTVTISAATLHPSVTPHLRYIAVSATGTDIVDLPAAQARGIRVTNCPGANLDAVSEHAISLYFASRRRTVVLDRKTRETPSEWKREGSLQRCMRLPDGAPPLTCREEVMGVIGYGGLGKRIADLGRALGMEVLVAARKDPDSDRMSSVDTERGPMSSADNVPPSSQLSPLPNAGNITSPPRIPFDDILRRATVLVLSLPRNPETANLISTAEFHKMHPYAVLINIARGGIVDEAAVVAALKDKQIAGYATDVYEVEPVGGPEDSPLVGKDTEELNITLTPHLAWYAQSTLRNLGDILKDTVESWGRGEDINVIV